MTGDRRTWLAPTLFFGWWSLLALLPIGHLTGLRNAWTFIVVVATLAWVGREAWNGLPARWLLVALLAWTAASIGWSTEPSLSFGKWRSDLLLPLLAYAAAYGHVRRTGSIAAIACGLVSGLVLLAGISAFAYAGPHAIVELQRWIRMEPFPNIEQPMPVWYPGVGDASMAASLAAGLLIFWRRFASAAAQWLGVLAWIAIAFVVVVANNRNAQIAIPLVALVCAYFMRRRPERAPTAAKAPAVWRRVFIAVVLLALVVAIGLRLESGAKERLDAQHVALAPGASAFVELTSRDTRPMIWTYYTRLALQAPWIGVGFGRTVPGVHYRTQDDRELAKVESNAYSHAHNLFLNWWLQTGFVGVGLLIATLVEVVRSARRDDSRAGRSPRARVIGHATMAIVVLMLIRDATDDFLVYGMATLFWVLIGALAGSRSGEITEPRGP